MDCRNCENKKCIINQYCSPDWVEYVQKVKTTSHLSKEKRIFSEGDLVHGIYIVCAGKIMLSMHFDNKHDEILRLAGSGQILGHRGFYQDMVYPISADTIEQSEIAFIPNDDFIKLVRKNPDFSLFLIQFYASELLQADRKLKLAASNSLRNKVLFALQRVYDAFGTMSEDNIEIEMGLDLGNLANFAAISPEDLIEVLDELKADSKLVLDGDTINVLDKEYFLSHTNI